MKSLLIFFLSALLIVAVAQTPAQNWPSFRGPHASGIADGQNLPTEWSVETGQNIKWRSAIPGFAHSSPIVWDDRIFVTTAVSENPNTTFEKATSGRAVSEDSERFEWKIVALHKKTGQTLWETAAYEGVPRTKRHQKSSHCNSTPTTNGRFVAAIMGSEGLYCFDLQGKVVWRKDLGVLDAGYVGKPQYQWGHASSPIMYRNMVIVQIDKFEGSYLAAYDIESGGEVWSVDRKELPTWSTPTIREGEDRIELITNGGYYARSYDPTTGEELWRFADQAEVKVPTPFVSDGVIYLAGGAPRGRRMTAIRVGGTGDLSLAGGEPSDSRVLWQRGSAGTYTVTPIAYGGHLYTGGDNGILTCHQASTGDIVYKERLGGSFSASPVAGDGRLYFVSEDGEVFVIQAGEDYALLAKNEMGESCMATPALSDGMIFIRTQKKLYAIGT